MVADFVHQGFALLLIDLVHNDDAVAIGFDSLPRLVFVVEKDDAFLSRPTDRLALPIGDRLSSDALA